MKTGFTCSAVALAALSVTVAATAATQVAKGDDKYAETSNAKERDERVAFVAKVHEVGLPLKYSAYVMKGTDKANAPVYVMMEYEQLVGVAREGVQTKPHHYYYGIPDENKYSDHRPQFEEAFKTLKSVVIANRIER